MDMPPSTDPIRMPGLYRAWDLQFVLHPGADYEISFANTSGDGTPLFAVYKRPLAPRQQGGAA